MHTSTTKCDTNKQCILQRRLVSASFPRHQVAEIGTSTTWQCQCRVTLESGRRSQVTNDHQPTFPQAPREHVNCSLIASGDNNDALVAAIGCTVGAVLGMAAASLAGAGGRSHRASRPLSTARRQVSTPFIVFRITTQPQWCTFHAHRETSKHSSVLGQPRVNTGAKRRHAQ